VEAQPTLRVAVQIDSQRDPNPWEAWQHTVSTIVHDDGSFGNEARLLRDDGRTITRLFPGFEVPLHRDEAEGYYLNVSSGAPVWFVMWRVDDEDPGRAWPERVTVSYHEAGRLLDAQERVDNLPLPSDVRDWLQAYTDANYRPEPKQRRRPQSFKAPEERG
jgi:Protein of unknown function (DUF3305)